jgi:predicted nucleotidyltransferase
MDSLVDGIVRRIAQAVRPEKIILFGSRASGEVHGDSDVDLVIIYSGPKSKRALRIGIHKLFEHPDFSMDVFVMTPQEFETQKAIPNTLAREISERGIVCYG